METLKGDIKRKPLKGSHLNETLKGDTKRIHEHETLKGRH